MKLFIINNFDFFSFVRALGVVLRFIVCFFMPRIIDAPAEVKMVVLVENKKFRFSENTVSFKYFHYGTYSKVKLKELTMNLSQTFMSKFNEKVFLIAGQDNVSLDFPFKFLIKLQDAASGTQKITKDKTNRKR